MPKCVGGGIEQRLGKWGVTREFVSRSRGGLDGGMARGEGNGLERGLSGRVCGPGAVGRLLDWWMQSKEIEKRGRGI